MPLIVLEGADGCGKSYLAKALMEKANRPHYVHATYKFKNAMTLYHTAIIKRAIPRINDGQTVILDRWWPSEMAYGKVYRNSHEPIENLRMIHRLGLRYGAVYVLCHRYSQDQQVQEFKRLAGIRSEMYEADDRIGKIHEFYQHLWDVSSRGQEARWLKYNLDTALQNVHYFTYSVNTIVKCAEHYGRTQGQNERTIPHSTGNFCGKYIMVGEKTNPTYHRLDFPWVGYRGSSLAVTTALRELEVPESDFFWTNAQGPGNHAEQLKAFIAFAPQSVKVVAMGDVARKFCEAAGRCDVAMNHPAYLTRFHGQKTLTTTLRKVLDA